MRVVIFEPKFVGHFLGFASVAAKAFADLGCDVKLLVPKLAQDTPQSRIKLGDVHENVEVVYDIDVPKIYQKWVNAKLETEALAAALDRYEVDHLVIPSGDFVLSGLIKNGRLRRRVKSLPGIDLVMHNCQQVYPELGIRQTIKCVLDRLAVSLAGRIRLLTVDPYATSNARRSCMAFLSNPVEPLPHFREVVTDRPSKHQARNLIGLPEQGRFFGSIGDLGRRKGTELLIDSYARSGPGENDALVLFGLLSGTAKETLQRHQKLVDEGRVIVRDAFVSESDFLNFFYAMDGIWAGFPHQVGIASTQLFAAEARCPVISSTYGAVGWLTDEYELGRTFQANLRNMSDALSWFHQAGEWAPNEEGVNRLLSYHTTENFCRCLTAALRKRAPELNLQPTPELAEPLP